MTMVESFHTWTCFLMYIFTQVVIINVKINVGTVHVHRAYITHKQFHIFKRKNINNVCMISMFDEQFSLCLSLSPGSFFLTRPISGLACTVKLASFCEVSNISLSIRTL